MLPRNNRITKGDVFRSVLSDGMKSSDQVLICNVLADANASSDHPARLGLIVSRACGNSVERNLIKRRLRATFSELLPGLPLGLLVVLRAQPKAKEISFDELRRSLESLLQRSMSKARSQNHSERSVSDRIEQLKA